MRVGPTALIVGSLAWLAAGEARATSDGGLTPRLLAFAGKDERWAVVALESVQEPCGVAPCTVVAVDLGASSYAERWPFDVPQGDQELGVDELLDAFLANADPGALRPLHPVEPSAGDALAVVDGRIEADAGVLTLEERRRVPSMRPYSRGSQEDCGMFPGGDRCSSCEQRQVTVNGAPLENWACEQAPGTFVGSGAPCDCFDEARVLALAGKGFVSREILVAPYRLGQNVMNGPGIEPDTEVGISEHTGRIHRNAERVPLVLAGAVHAAMANGTYLPLVAYRPAKGSDVPSPEPATPMTPGAGEGVDVELRSAPPSGGCAGCTAGGRDGRDGSWWSLGGLCVMLLSLRRR